MAAVEEPGREDLLRAHGGSSLRAHGGPSRILNSCLGYDFIRSVGRCDSSGVRQLRELRALGWAVVARRCPGQSPAHPGADELPVEVDLIASRPSWLQLRSQRSGPVCRTIDLESIENPAGHLLMAGWVQMESVRRPIARAAKFGDGPQVDQQRSALDRDLPDAGSQSVPTRSDSRAEREPVARRGRAIEAGSGNPFGAAACRYRHRRR